MFAKALKYFPRGKKEFAVAAKAIRDWRAGREEPLETKWGFLLQGPESMRKGTFEAEETELLRTLFPNYELLVNVGANIGYYVCHALSMGLESIAIEPHPGNLRSLLRNIRANGWVSEVHGCACGEKNDVLELFGGGTAASLLHGWAGIKDRNPVLVPVLPLDSILGGRFAGRRTLFLIDVEGFELMVLKGAKQTFSKPGSGDWVVEISVDEHYGPAGRLNPNLLETFDQFFSAGFRCFKFSKGFEEVLRKDIAEIAASGQNPLGVHNFFFTTGEAPRSGG